MHRLVLGTTLIVVLLGSMSLANGQKATEIFIPVGQSPGLSNQFTYIGNIESIDTQARVITVGDGQTVRVTGQTKIWLDRTKLKVTNQVGRFVDLKLGQRCEIMFVDPNRKQQVAEWIKVEVAQP